MADQGESAPEAGSSGPDAAHEQMIKRLFKQKSCIDCDLSGLDLSDRSLKGFDLERARLQGCNLSGANLRQANLKGDPFLNMNHCLQEAKIFYLHKACTP